ncbi:MAG: alkaline phytoceramidase [Bacteroidota bacterium]
MPVKLQIKYGILVSITVIAVVAVVINGSIPQDASYDAFADTRSMLMLPNFWNVFSNLPFLLIGLAGILFLMFGNSKNTPPLFINCLVFFVGIFFTGIGSAYYHYFPSNCTLVWDRLPMTISFMSFFSIIIGEYICLRSAKRILFPLIFIGIMSIIYWQMTESKGYGDLRFYVLVQFLPIVLIPIIMLLFQSQQKVSGYFWLMILSYGFAKLFEANDHLVFNEFQLLSGHTIKHIFAAFTPTIFLVMLWKKNAINDF